MNPYEIDWDKQREILVKTLKREGVIKTKDVYDTFMQVPRHLFVPDDIRSRAYKNNALPIGFGQTISQPLIVAMMTELISPGSSDRILEIGTGSGYQAAILSRLCSKVYTIERIEELSLRAQQVFDNLGYENIVVRVGDGTLGWTEEAPFDGIVVTAAAPQIPQTLLGQLKDDGGVLVMPEGHEYYQEMVRVVKEGNNIKKEKHGGCIFVKLIGAEGWGK